MYANFKIEPPFFEFGPKVYWFGEQILPIARFADQLAVQYDVRIILTPQYVDIPLLAANTRNIFIFAQHMDPVSPGRGVGAVLPESLKAAGAHGVMLNHAEHPLSLDVIRATIQRADEVGLASMVCAGNPSEVLEIAKMNPNILLAEQPELIGIGKRAENDCDLIAATNRSVWQINPAIRVLHGAGITDDRDVYNVMAAGAQATGSTSGIIKANNPFDMFEAMIKAVHTAWTERNNPQE